MLAAHEVKLGDSRASNDVNYRPSRKCNQRLSSRVYPRRGRTAWQAAKQTNARDATRRGEARAVKLAA